MKQIVKKFVALFFVALVTLTISGGDTLIAQAANSPQLAQRVSLTDQKTGKRYPKKIKLQEDHDYELTIALNPKYLKSKGKTKVKLNLSTNSNKTGNFRLTVGKRKESIYKVEYRSKMNILYKKVYLKNGDKLQRTDIYSLQKGIKIRAAKGRKVQIIVKFQTIPEPEPKYPTPPAPPIPEPIIPSIEPVDPDYKY